MLLLIAIWLPKAALCVKNALVVVIMSFWATFCCNIVAQECQEEPLGDTLP